jgi:RimJ/RimL family protein N-acetyltransferase
MMRHWLTTTLGPIAIRPYKARDIPPHVSYLHDSAPSFLEQIGFDLEQFPNREACTELFAAELAQDRSVGFVRRVVGELEGQTVSLASIEIPKDEPDRYAHFHILEPALRGCGLGSPLLVVSLRALMDQHQLDRIYLEPGAHNPPINRLLVKLGLPLVGSLDKAAGLWALRVRVNRYEATRAKVEALVASIEERFELAVA